MSVFMVDAVTVEAINGVRERGFWGEVKAQPTQADAYQLVSVDKGEVYATVSAGVVTYEQEKK